MTKGMALQFKVTNQTIERLDSYQVYEKSQGYLYAQFIFSEDWKGYTKTIKFSNVLTDAYIGVTLGNDNMCIVPYNLILYPAMSICIEGVKGANIITTNSIAIDVDKSESTTPHIDTPITEINSVTLDYEKTGSTATLNVKSEVLDEVDNTIEITSEDATIEGDKIVFNSDIAQEIMSMNKRLKVDASITDPTVTQGTYIGVFTPRGIIDYSLPDGTIIYEYTTTNWLIDTFLTTYVEFRWDATTEKLYVTANKPTIYEHHIVGFNNDGSGGIGLTSNMDLCTSHINTLRINDLETVSTQNQPSLEFNANGNDELESIVFKQDGSTADFTYTIPKGAKHYVVNELPTTNIDTTGNYYVMTESENARGYLSTDINNLTTTEYPPSNPSALRQDATVNSGDWVKLNTSQVASGDYMGDIAIKFNIPCEVTVSVNPRQTRLAFMYIDVNGTNVKLVSAGETESYTRTFNKDETLCVRGASFSTNDFYYKLAIQPYTIDGKIPLSTNVDEYINFENLWFKNGGSGGGKLYHHHILIEASSEKFLTINITSTSNVAYTYSTIYAYINTITNDTGYAEKGYNCISRNGRSYGYSCCATSNLFFSQSYDGANTFSINQNATVTDTITEA